MISILDEIYNLLLKNVDEGRKPEYVFINREQERQLYLDGIHNHKYVDVNYGSDGCVNIFRIEYKKVIAIVQLIIVDEPKYWKVKVSSLQHKIKEMV